MLLNQLFKKIGKAPAGLLIFVIKIYRLFISPRMLPSCKYLPTCSAYAVEALERHGFIKGFLLAAWRLLRCNPFSRGGYDPVPDKKKR